MVPLRSMPGQQEREFLLEFLRYLLHTRNRNAVAK
jgi:hypothetical protein